jgi:hypothetical protein
VSVSVEPEREEANCVSCLKGRHSRPAGRLKQKSAKGRQRRDGIRPRAGVWCTDARDLAAAAELWASIVVV